MKKIWRFDLASVYLSLFSRISFVFLVWLFWVNKTILNFIFIFAAPETVFYIPEQRLVHFDLKGAPPKMDYLLRMLKWVKDAGATGVLLEYEEMFPFSGRLSTVSASNHYNVSDINNIVNTCQQVITSKIDLFCYPWNIGLATGLGSPHPPPPPGILKASPANPQTYIYR